MAQMTMIARVIDGLPLVGTMQEDEQVKNCFHFQIQLDFPSNFIQINVFQSGRSVLEYQNQAKMLFRKLGPHSPARCTIETGPYLFQ